MDENIKSLIDYIVLNEEIPLKARFKALNSIVNLAKKHEITDYLTSQTKTKATITNQLASSALEELEE